MGSCVIRSPDDGLEQRQPRSHHNYPRFIERLVSEHAWHKRIQYKILFLIAACLRFVNPAQKLRTRRWGCERGLEIAVIFARRQSLRTSSQSRSISKNCRLISTTVWDILGTLRNSQCYRDIIVTRQSWWPAAVGHRRKLWELWAIANISRRHVISSPG